MRQQQPPVARTLLKIIGAALPRTGTMSLMEALEMLGYKVFHGSVATKEVELWGNLFYDIAKAELLDRNSAQREAAVQAVVEALSVRGYDAILDQPGCWLYQDLMKFYPDAMVINTVRDNRDAWAKSMVEMAYCLDLLAWQPPYSHRPISAMGRLNGYYSKSVGLGIKDEEIFEKGVPNSDNRKERESSVSYATCASAYDRYQAKVVATVPPHKLIRYSVKEGWGPLIEHFAKGQDFVQDTPFPVVNTNENGMLVNWRRTMKTKIALYNLHPILAQDWLVKFLLFCRLKWRATSYWMIALSVILFSLLLFRFIFNHNNSPTTSRQES